MNSLYLPSMARNALLPAVICGLLTLLACRTDVPTITPLENPSESGCCARLVPTIDDRQLMSWIHYVDDTTDALMFASLQGSRWSDPVEVRRGSNWFVNWADFPSVGAYPEGDKLSLHWLEMSGPQTFDYEIRMVQSTDGGQTWGEDFVLHQDGVQAEHGFVSQTPVSDDRMFASWLDGRRTKSPEDSDHGHDHGHGAGDMMLRGAIFTPDNRVLHEWRLDDRVCDCCGTASALTDRGLVVAYRDRSEEEVRDIAVVYQKGHEWSKPYIPHPDHWKIAGCPVNGPALDAIGDEVVLAWYGHRDDLAQVRVTFSNDAARSFGSSFRIDQGEPLGRADVAMLSDGRAMVVWLEKDAEKAALMAAIIQPDGTIIHLIKVANTTASRGSGFPTLSIRSGGALVAWTDNSDPSAGILTALVGFP